jgi:hypothetical protein
MLVRTKPRSNNTCREVAINAPGDLQKAQETTQGTTQPCDRSSTQFGGQLVNEPVDIFHSRRANAPTAGLQ